MSEYGEIIYTYDPENADRPLLESGATRGYVVLREGDDDEAHVAEAVMLTDPDGSGFVELTSPFKPTRIVVDE